MLCGTTNDNTKSVKFKNAVSATYLLLFYNTKKTGYTSVHSTLSSMQNVTVQFQKYRDTIDHHTASLIVQHMFERQETPRDPEPAGTV